MLTLLLVSTAAVSASAATTSEAKVTHSRHVVQFFRTHSWLRAPNQPNCQVVPWTRSCKIARRVFAKHRERLAAFERQWTIPNTGNWTRAMRYAQRPFPGTYDWLAFISNRECRACYTVAGGFVCNYGGSGACGPLQFMSGTFWGHMPAARAAVAAKGYRVPPEVWDWRNALGQALVGAYMRYTGQDGCHWCL